MVPTAPRRAGRPPPHTHPRNRSGGPGACVQRGWGGGCGAQRGSCSTGTGSGGRAHERGVTLLGDDSAPWKQGRVMLRRNPRGEAGLSWLTGSMRCLNSQHPGALLGGWRRPPRRCVRACCAPQAPVSRLRTGGLQDGGALPPSLGRSGVLPILPPQGSSPSDPTLPEG